MNQNYNTKRRKTDVNSSHKSDNRGIALITIVIAVAFISIIGTALLYISYTNFQMKVMNLGSKQNYYEADGELLNYSNAIRNIADKPASVEALITDDGTNKTINLSSALDMIGATGGVKTVDGDTYTYTTSATVKQGGGGSVTTYTIEDISVKQVSDKGYVNKVKTNLEIQILKQTKAKKGRKGVGECSMISDAAMTMCSAGGGGGGSDYDWDGFWAYWGAHGAEVGWNQDAAHAAWDYMFQGGGGGGSTPSYSATQFDFMTMFGDAYYSSYYYGSDGHSFGQFNGTGTYTMPAQYGVADPALHLANQAKLNFESDYMAVYGDLVLSDKSVLYISKGSLTVYGDIYVLGNAALICNGSIYQPESILPGRTKACGVYSDSGEITPTSSDWKKHVYYTGSIEKVTDDSFNSFCELLLLNDNDADNDGITKQISVDLNYWDKDNKRMTKIDVLNTVDNVPDGTTDGKINTSYYGIDCGIAFAEAGAQVGNVDAYQNYILFVTDGNSGSELQVRGSSVNTTLISSSPIKLDINSGVYYSKMGSEIYDYLTVKSDDEDNAYYDEDIHKVYLGFSGKDNDGNGVNSGGSPSDKDKNRFSAGDMLADDANPKIINLFTAGVNGGSTIPTYINSISFNSYVKDVD